MKLPFVSRKKYEEVLKHCEMIDKQLDYVAREYGVLIGVKEQLKNAENLKDALKNRVDELFDEINKYKEEFKDKEEHYKRSIAAFKFQSSRRKKRIDELQVLNRNSIKSLKELDDLNQDILERMRKIERENIDQQEIINKLNYELDRIKRKPTVEELKFENCLVEHHKLAGSRKKREGK